jgi:fatty acid kinase/fatty acid kinase fatty acid binding subunit
MTDIIDDTTRLSGAVFSRVVRAGALAVIREQEALNRINVFPVRDADTGANLAATLKAAASRLGSAAPDSVGDAARVAADGALDGARGNSGAIFAQFLHGLAASMERLRQADGSQFAAAAVRGTESAYSALQEPREGTILSVLRAWSHELSRRAHDEELPELLRSGLVAAREALAATPRQLEVLARNHVVDAGGQGFVFFLEGLIDALTGSEPAWVPIEAPPHGLPPFSGEHEEIDERFRFCTEALLTPRGGAALSRDEVMTRVADFGESLVVAGGDTRVRVHIHTNEPRRFFATVAELGHIERTKVDDMVLQQLACRATTLGLVTDSTTDLPEDEAIELGAIAVPLTLTLGDEEYLDGVDITLDGFIQRILAGSGPPRSSQPAVSDLAQTYRRLLECRDGVVSVHIAAALSGTVQAARTAAGEVDADRVRVIDSCSVSIGAGLLVEAVGEAISSGADLDEVERLAERVKREIRVFGAVKSLDFAARGGRVSARLAKSMDRLHLSPIIALDETGKAGRAGVALGFDRALNTIVKRVVHYADGAPARAMVVHTGDQAGADFVAARLSERLGGDVPVVRAGAVLTTHVGLGCVTAAVRRLHA